MIWLYLWAIPAIVICASMLIREGYHDKIEGAKNLDVGFLVFFIPLVSALWPIVVLLGVVSSPYWLGRLAGGYKKRKHEKYLESLEDKVEALKALRDQFKKTEPEWEVLTEMLEEANYQYGTA